MKKITFERACEILFYILGTIAIVLVFNSTCNAKAETTENARDLSYEEYCDSVWANDPDYYLDVLCTTDKFQSYIETNGEWWH